ARILDGSSRHAGRKGKKSFKKIVQICALLCSRAIHDFRLYFSVFRWSFSIPIWCETGIKMIFISRLCV
ncbi:hypothetical protein HID37_005377, partial [Escherichia coli]|nr:hypothetical protein [Escherichia coli]